MISFIETKLFTRLVHEYLSDDEYSELQQALLANPEAGAVISGSGGIRKLRWALLVAANAAASGSSISFARGRANLDANALSEERCREHPGACSETDQGRNRWLRPLQSETLD